MVDGQFAGDARCQVTQALTLAQILEKIARSGGSVWAADEPVQGRCETGSAAA